MTPNDVPRPHRHHRVAAAVAARDRSRRRAGPPAPSAAGASAGRAAAPRGVTTPKRARRRAYVARVPGDVLSARALNRALLARQGLLARTAVPALAMVERLAGMQAQIPENHPYVALWSRLEAFDPAELSGLVRDRRAVRAQLMRATIHLVSTRDARFLHPLPRAALARVLKTAWLARPGGAPVDDVVAAGAELLAERPRTRAELAAALAPRWPAAD